MFAMSLTLTACGGGDDDSGAASSSESTSASESSAESGAGGADDGYGEGSPGGADAAGTITISGFSYGDPLTVAPGVLVTVINEDAEPHSATAEDGSFDTGLFGQGEQMTFTAPAAAGTYNILCTAHPDMAGQLIVAG